MREAYPSQPTLDMIPIAQVSLNLECRDEIIPILAALRHLYADATTRDQILDLIGDLYVLGRPLHAHLIARFVETVQVRDPDVLENHNIFAFDLST